MSYNKSISETKSHRIIDQYILLYIYNSQMFDESYLMNNEYWCYRLGKQNINEWQRWENITKTHRYVTNAFRH